MSLSITKEKSSIIVKPKNLDFDLHTIDLEFDSQFKNLILDLSKFENIENSLFQNFTNFGMQIVKENSFVIVFKGSYKDTFPIVPSLEEAFDFVQMEEIERMLK